MILGIIISSIVIPLEGIIVLSMYYLRKKGIIKPHGVDPQP